MKVMQDSPVEQRRKELPQGNGNFPGYYHVYSNIAKACDAMGQSPYIRLSQEHVNAMAILGCGHEETMKYEQQRLRYRGFIK